MPREGGDGQRRLGYYCSPIWDHRLKAKCTCYAPCPVVRDPGTACLKYGRFGVGYSTCEVSEDMIQSIADTQHEEIMSSKSF